MGVGVSRPVFVRVGVYGGWERVCTCVGMHACCIVWACMCCVCEGVDVWGCMCAHMCVGVGVCMRGLGGVLCMCGCGRK